MNSVGDTLKVYYDRVHDVVSLYLEKEDTNTSPKNYSKTVALEVERQYSFDEAASLLLDMVDILDSEGNFMGFRVFNASRYYDLDLLNSADEEILDESNLKRPDDKIIAKVANGQIIY